MSFCNSHGSWSLNIFDGSPQQERIASISICRNNPIYHITQRIRPVWHHRHHLSSLATEVHEESDRPWSWGSPARLLIYLKYKDGALFPWKRGPIFLLSLYVYFPGRWGSFSMEKRAHFPAPFIWLYSRKIGLFFHGKEGPFHFPALFVL